MSRQAKALISRLRVLDWDLRQTARRLRQRQNEIQDEKRAWTQEDEDAYIARKHLRDYHLQEKEREP